MAVLMFVLLFVCSLFIMFRLRRTAVVSFFIAMALLTALFLHDITTALTIQL